MKKIVFIVSALLMLTNETLAFNTFAHQAITALTEMNLTDKAKSDVKAILKGDLQKDCVWLNTLRKKPEMEHTKSWHFTQLNSFGKSVTTDENDGIVQLENAIAVLRDRANHSEALVQESLRKVIHLVQDLHCLSHIYIDGYEGSKGFTYRIWNEAPGKYSKSWNEKWYNRWESGYAGRYAVFTPQYYAEDIDIYANKKKAEYSTGTPRFWVENAGEDVVRALEDFYSDNEIPIKITMQYEYLHTKCMAKAAYRLAALLNDIFK